jgi:hypothetical protein
MNRRRRPHDPRVSRGLGARRAHRPCAATDLPGPALHGPTPAGAGALLSLPQSRRQHPQDPGAALAPRRGAGVAKAARTWPWRTSAIPSPSCVTTASISSAERRSDPSPDASGAGDGRGAPAPFLAFQGPGHVLAHQLRGMILPELQGFDEASVDGALPRATAMLRSHRSWPMRRSAEPSVRAS